jgi:diguanylate cyclase (GGDEF)-like protein
MRAMQSFKGIASNWLTAVAEKQLDMTFQVVETNRSDSLAHCISTLAFDLGIKVFSVEYPNKVIADPLEIFHIITRWYGDTYGYEIVESLIESCCYPMHQETIKKWYHREFHYRKEPILYDEAGYEELEFFSSLEIMLDEFAKRKPFVILISQLDNAPVHVMTSLNRLLDSRNISGTWGVMGFVQQVRRPRRMEENGAWHDCLRRLERQGLILPFQVEKKSEDAFLWHHPASLKSFEEQFRMITLAADMFAYQDVIRMVEHVRRKYNDKHNGQMLFLSAFCSLMSGDHDTAVRDFSKVQNRLQSTENQAILLASYFWQSICYTLKSQEKYARGAQEQCEKLALEYDEHRWYVLSQFSAFYINAHIAQHQLTQASLESLRFLLSELGYNNMLSLLLTQVYSHTEHYDQVSSKTYLKNCVLSLRSARTKKNMLGISMALHAMGVVYMRIGNFKQTQRLYQLSLNIRERYQRNADLVPMLNGLGYFLVGQEEWQKAWSLFDRALSLLIEHRNFNEVSITLYNFVWLYTQSGSIQRALDTMNDLLELMRIRGVESVPFRNLKDLYVLKGWLHILLQQPIQARYCLIRIQAYTQLHQTSFSKVLHDILAARIALYEDEKTLAMRDNTSAYTQILKIDDLDLYMDTSLKLEIARMFVDLGRKEDATPIFSALRTKARDFQLDALAQRISRASLGISSLSESQVPKIAQPYQVLLELAQKDTQLASLQHELSDLHQVNLLVETSASEPDLMRFLSHTIDILDRRIPAGEFALIIRSNEKSEQPIQYVVSNELPNLITSAWQDKLEKCPPKETYFENNGDQCAAWPLRMETADTGWLVISGDIHQKTVWNVDFLSLLAQQLGLILDRRLREAFLEHRNKTDLLTGVMNREGLFERLKKQFSQMQRDPEQDFALCYFDLDHFKYFNDQFGHELGDRVLKNLVQCVEHQLRGMDELGRLGGDEFIILLRQANQKDLELLLERLRAAVASPDWWLPLLVEPGNQNPVPKEEWISASFGAVIVDNWPAKGISRIDLLAQGDAAMYEAKAKGRNCVVIKTFDVPGPKEDLRQ